MESFMENTPCSKGQEEDIMKLHAWKDATTIYARVSEAGKWDISQLLTMEFSTQKKASLLT